MCSLPSDEMQMASIKFYPSVTWCNIFFLLLKIDLYCTRGEINKHQTQALCQEIKGKSNGLALTHQRKEPPYQKILFGTNVNPILTAIGSFISGKRSRIVM